MDEKKILLIPSVTRTGGYGHLRRCLEASKTAGIWVYWPESRNNFPFDPEQHRDLDGKILRELPSDQRFDLVVADTRRTGKALFAELQKAGRLVIGLDEGGRRRKEFPFLLDVLGNLDPHHPNLQAPGMGTGPLKDSRQGPGSEPLLVSFGGEDPADLTGKFYRIWKNWGPGRPEKVTVVIGPYFRHRREYPGWNEISAPQGLRPLMDVHRDLVTSYGLTAWEGLAAGMKVFLMNPTKYHDKLGEKAGFAQGRSGLTGSRKSFFKSWGTREQKSGSVRRVLGTQRSLGEFLSGFRHTPDRCPVCHSRSRRILFRTPHKTYSRCRDCSMVYLTAYNLESKTYSKSYFQEEYSRQYGRTYLEDFGHIKEMGRGRVAVLRSLGLKAGDTVLDAGCAYGPFLAAASEAGLKPAGLDVAADAVDHVRSNLGFPAVEKSLLDLVWAGDFPGEGPLNALTLWYVIEHFPDLEPVLRVLNRNLAPGGLLAFSTPNLRGITGIFSPQKFYRESPEDHFSLWSPANCRKILDRYGFRVEKIRVTGHHPERFPGVRPDNAPVLKILGKLSVWFGWGDTFEVYARKVKNI